MARRSKKDRLSTLIDPVERDVIRRCQERIQAEHSAKSDMRSAVADDLRFLLPGGQWDEGIRSQRESEGRPCLEVDRLTPFVSQLVNEQRQNRPQPTVNPVGDGADKETAEILQGLIRHIMYMSDGDTAIDTAYESVIRTGVGYVRVYSDYVSDDSFEQELRIGRIADPLSVAIDPSSDDPAGSDAEWGAIETWLSKAEFESQFPNSKLKDADRGAWEAVSNAAPEWATEDGEGVMVVEYFERECEFKTIYALRDGGVSETKPPDVMPSIDPVTGELMTPPQVRSRKVATHKLKWYKLNAVEILEESEWPGRYIPIVPVYGNELYVDGKRTYSGLVRTAKDPARFYNYWKSCQAETIALAPKAPFIVPKGAIVDPGTWRRANQEPVAYLEYNSTVDGQPVNMPQRDMAEPPIQAISMAMAGAEQDIKAVTGMYDPVRGLNTGGQSGVAIRQLQRQGQSVNFHYSDNLARSQRHLGRMLIDLIPHYYDTPRVIRIVKPDNTEDMVQLNQEYMDPKSGMVKIYRTDVGRYDVTVSVGPSYQTRRQESQAMLESLMQNPTMGALMAQKASDILVGLLDFHEAKELQERLRPPEYADNSKVPPQVQQQMQQMQQAIQQFQAQLQQAGQTIQELQAENQSKQAEIQLKMHEMQMKGASEAEKSELERMKLQLEAEKLVIERRKLDIEAAGLKLEALRGVARPAMPLAPGAEQPEGMDLAPDSVDIELEVPEDMQMPMARRPITAEEVGNLLAQQSAAFQEAMATAVSGMESIVMAPRPAPAPVSVVLRKNRDGSVSGEVR